MKNKKAIIFIIVLVIITGAAAFAHLSSREEAPEHGIQVTAGSELVVLDLEKMNYTTVTGTYVTGKGEEREVQDPGISLEEILKYADIETYESVVVTADDSYSVEVAAGEDAHFIKEEDSLRLIVFGDKDSKRNVKNVVKIEVK